MDVKWQYADSSDTSLRVGKDELTKQPVGFLRKNDSGFYDMYLFDRTRADGTLYAGSRATLTEAQDYVESIIEALRKTEVARHQRGELSTIELVSLVAEMVEENARKRDLAYRANNDGGPSYGVSPTEARNILSRMK